MTNDPQPIGLHVSEYRCPWCGTLTSAVETPLLETTARRRTVTLNPFLCLSCTEAAHA